MILLFATLMFVPWTTDGINTGDIKNKTKRTLSHELFNYGETKPVYVYSDNLGSHSTARELPNLSSGSKSLTLVSAPQVLKVYDQQVSPKVVPQPQQLLYEYPVATNTVPNVQVRHFIQPLGNYNQDLTTQNTQIPDYKEQISPTNGPNFVPSETVVLPVQQRQNPALITSNNGQPYSNIRFHPIHNAQTVPRKFVYVNGKIYDPSHFPYLHQNINQPQVNPLLVVPHQHLQYYPQQRSERPPIINYVNRNHSPRLNLNTPANVSPITYNRLPPSPKKQLPPITSSLTVPHKNNEQSEQDNEEKIAPVKEKDENEENSEEKSNDQEEDFEQHDQNPIFNKYSFDDYEENDHQDYKDHKEVQDDEDEEDNKRGSTKRVASKKYPRKYSKGGKHSSDYYRYSDSDSKYDHPEEKSNHKNKRRPKMFYKSVKYSREINNKPKGDSIEGRYSENVPVTHKHNRVFKEKWYISKTDENLEAK